MDKERSSAILKIVLEVCAGISLIFAVACLGGKLFDTPIVILISILIAAVTLMLVRQDREILSSAGMKG